MRSQKACGREYMWGNTIPLYIYIRLPFVSGLCAHLKGGKVIARQINLAVSVFLQTKGRLVFAWGSQNICVVRALTEGSSYRKCTCRGCMYRFLSMGFFIRRMCIIGFYKLVWSLSDTTGKTLFLTGSICFTMWELVSSNLDWSAANAYLRHKCCMSEFIYIRFYGRLRVCLARPYTELV